MAKTIEEIYREAKEKYQREHEDEITKNNVSSVRGQQLVFGDNMRL